MRDAISAPLSDKAKAAIRVYYEWKCQYCGADGADQVDHIIARAKGGPDTIGNSTLSCQPCNLRKSDTDLDIMFVAIAHARARDAAPRILALLTRKERAEVPRSARPGEVVLPIWIIHTRWGILQWIHKQEGVVRGYMTTSYSGHRRGGSEWLRVRRPRGACRDLMVDFSIDVVTQRITFGSVRLWREIVDGEPALTDHERDAGCRYFRRFAWIVTQDSRDFLAKVCARLPHLAVAH